jgi:von Willebrand factor type A domain
MFEVKSYPNSYLTLGATRLDALVEVTARGVVGTAPTANLVEGFLIDNSGSMQEPMGGHSRFRSKMEAANHAVSVAIEQLPASATFFVITFSEEAVMVVPPTRAGAAEKAAAQRRVQLIRPVSDTRMSNALLLARRSFAGCPDGIHHATFLTDGKNSAGDVHALASAVDQAKGLFQCDARGLGADWQKDQLELVARSLLGTADMIPDAEGVAGDFRAIIGGMVEKGVREVRLGFWSPKVARITEVKQTLPENLPILAGRSEVDARSFTIPTGAWADGEAREYYVVVEFASAGDPGDERLAFRPFVTFRDPATGLDQTIDGPDVAATWSDDASLTSRINDRVAHALGQGELSEAIAAGLAAKAAGDLVEATARLGRAVQLADQFGNAEATKRLAGAVEIISASEGTVRVKSAGITAEDRYLEMGGTRTVRARSASE